MHGGSENALQRPHGVVLNAVALTCAGVHLVTKGSAPTSSEERAEIQARIGSTIFQQGAYCYKGGVADLPNSSSVEIACDANRPLHLFDIKDAVHVHAVSLGLRSWFGFGGVLHVAGLPGEQIVDDLLVEQRLRLRVVDDGMDGLETSLVVRADTRWMDRSVLSDISRRESTIGESVEKLGGDGPRRGRIVSIDSEGMVIDDRGVQHAVQASDYAVAANSRFITVTYGARLLQRLQIASGALASSGQRNKYAVKDRYDSIARGLNALGRSFDLPGGGTVSMADVLVDIRIQDAP